MKASSGGDSTRTGGLSPAPSSGEKTTNWARFITVAALLVLCFSSPLLQLGRFALKSELYSHLLLIPLVSAYLVWLKREQLTRCGPRLTPIWTILFFVTGGGLLAAYLFNASIAANQTPQDSLALVTFALVLLFIGVCCLFLNRPTLRVIAFPLGLLFFLAPFPVVVEEGLETFLQHGSSVVAQAFFQIIGTPVFRDGTLFHLPGFNMQVAPECSGIHSTLALFITSLAAGQVLLRSPMSQAVLTLSVLPIALLRNGLRVTTIGELCVRIGPEMIESYIHRHGGPIFFIISLIPFTLLLFFLLKLDRKKALRLKPTS